MIVLWGLGFRSQLSGDNTNRRQWVLISFAREDLGPGRLPQRGLRRRREEAAAASRTWQC